MHDFLLSNLIVLFRDVPAQFLQARSPFKFSIRLRCLNEKPQKRQLFQACDPIEACSIHHYKVPPSSCVTWSKILILLNWKETKVDCHLLGKSISQSYQGLMTWGFNDADEHPLCSTLTTLAVKWRWYWYDKMQQIQDLLHPLNLTYLSRWLIHFWNNLKNVHGFLWNFQFISILMENFFHMGYAKSP